VLSIHRDADGFLWVGTQNGLNRLDGNANKVYRWEGRDGQIVSYIHLIREDLRGRLWLGTHEGLFCMDRREGMIRPAFEAGSQAETSHGTLISALRFDHRQRMWLGSYVSGLAIFEPDTGRFEPFVHDAEVPGSFPAGWERVRDVLPIEDGSAWVGTSEGLLFYDGETERFEVVCPLEAGLPLSKTGTVTSLHRDREGLIWVGTQGNGIFALDGDRRLRHWAKPGSKQLPLSHAGVHGMTEDASGTLWIPTDFGLNAINPERNQVVHYHHERSNPRSIGSNVLSKHPLADDGMLWVGTRYSSLWYADLDQNRFSAFPSFSSLGVEEETVTSLLPWDSGTLLVATDGGGVFVRDPAKGGQLEHRFVKTLRNLPLQKALVMKRGASNTLWIGTWMEGLWHVDLDSGEARQYLHQADTAGSLPDDAVFDMLLTQDRRLWLGTWGKGVGYLDLDSGLFYGPDHPPAIPLPAIEGPITRILEDSRGTLWFASELGGLAKYDARTGVTVRFSQRQADRPEGARWLVNDSINCLFEDSRGRIWIGSNAGGVSVLDPETLSFPDHPLLEALRGESVVNIMEDRHGMLWLATSNGLVQFCEQTGRITWYGEDDGLHGLRFGRWAYAELESGDLLFGGSLGYTRVHTGVFAEPARVARSFITNWNSEGTSIPLPVGNTGASLDASGCEPVRLPSTTRNLSFSYTAPCFRQPSKQHFVVMLEGLEPGWSSPTGMREATYRNLSHGTYRFRVRTSCEEGTWKGDETSIAFVIATPWFHQWWFRLGMAVAVLITIGGYIQWRIRRYRKNQRILERRVFERTRELNESNALLAEQRSQIEAQHAKLRRISENREKLISIFAHDVKNPFGAIMGMADALSESYQDMDEGERLTFITMMRDASHEVYELLQKLLYWALSGDERLPFRPERLNLRETLQPAIEIYRSVATQKEQELHIQQPDRDLFYSGDPQLLTMLVRNLLNNATKFCPKRGRITLEVDATDDGICIQVKDSGKGFDAAFLDARLGCAPGGPDFAGVEGTGIGLQLCSAIVEMHGGTMVFMNQPEGGAWVKVTLASVA
jgi:ligand-binding sensor domain-containing protein/signal transduction histidine kinase